LWSESWQRVRAWPTRPSGTTGRGFALEEAPPGHGLDTLRAQLAALYGDQAWLEVHPEGIGTRVAMWLPALSAEGRLR
jgi:hypothetical protein